MIANVIPLSVVFAQRKLNVSYCQQTIPSRKQWMLQWLSRQLKRTFATSAWILMAKVNKVKCHPFSPCGRMSAQGWCHDSNDKQNLSTGATKWCFQCSLTNHSPDNCNYKNSECFHCRRRGHLQSDYHNTKPPCKKGMRDNTSVKQIRI